MKQVITQASFFLLVVGAVSNSFAAPMGFKNSWMLMGDFSKTYQEFGLNYATTANDAFGISASAMQTDNSVSKQQNLEAVYTRKLARWNLPEAQANIWFIGGLGSYAAQGATSNITTARLGASFYEADYDEPQPWIVVEARRMTFVSKQYEFTPMVRVIHKRYFVEAGANLSGQLRFNFMYNY